MAVHSTNKPITKQGLATLAALSQSDAYRHVVFSNQGPETCFSALQAFGDDVQTCTVTLSVLSELCQAGAGQRRQLAERGILKQLTEVVRAHFESEAIMELVIDILQLLAGIHYID